MTDSGIAPNHLPQGLIKVAQGYFLALATAEKS
jgi:hypothetical protein